MKFNDIASGILLLCLAIVLWIGARLLPNPAGETYGAGFFPMWIAAGMGISSILLIITSVARLRKSRAVSISPGLRDPSGVARFLLVPAAILFYVFVVEHLGFVPTATIIVIVLESAFGVRLRTSIPVGVGVVAVIYVIFALMLHVTLPRNLLMLIT